MKRETCARCSGYDERCPACVARRLARKHGEALDVTDPDPSRFQGWPPFDLPPRLPTEGEP